MFIRCKKKQNKNHSFNQSVQLVESFRDGKTVRQKIIKHIGVAYNEQELADLKALALSIKEKLETGVQPSLFSPEQLPAKEGNKTPDAPAFSDEDYQVDIRELVEQGRVIKGIHDIYGALFDELDVAKTFKNPSNQKAKVNMFKQIVMARIANPDSKRASVHALEEQFGVSLNLDKVYRMMDSIDDQAIARLNEIAYSQTRQLFNNKIDVIFFDATTLYFESFVEDEFKKNGYSKDLKFNQPQVVLALMVTKEGLPIGYQAFSGDTFDGHTLLPALQQLREKYDLDKVVYVADSGMFNQQNLLQLEEQNFDYIVGARIKNLPNKLTEQVLDMRHYRQLNTTIKVARFEHKGRILVVTHSQKRARKDQADRDKGIAKLREKLILKKSPKDYLSNQGYKKYLQITGECNGELTLNEEKIAQASAWDGLKALIISKECQLSDAEILEQYNNLWQVEQSFRITKHDLKIRPIYHWKPARVKAHLAISFAAYMLTRHLEYRVKLQYKKLSPAVIRSLLISVQTSILSCDKKRIRYAIPSPIKLDAKKIYRLMGVETQTTPYILEKY